LGNGRAIFSAGRGYDEREYRAFEIPFEESRTRFDEELLLIRKLWTETDVTWHGQHHTIRDPITLVPRPVQQPHPPVYVACFSEPTMRMAAEQGFNIIFAPFAASMVFGSLAAAVARFKELATAAGHPDSTAMCSYFTCIADTAQDKRVAQERLLYYLTNFIPAVPQDPEKAPPHIRYFVDIAERVKRMRPEDLGERSIVTGTVDEVIRQFEQRILIGATDIGQPFGGDAVPQQLVFRDAGKQQWLRSRDLGDMWLLHLHVLRDDDLLHRLPNFDELRRAGHRVAARAAVHASRRRSFCGVRAVPRAVGGGRPTCPCASGSQG